MVQRDSYGRVLRCVFRGVPMSTAHILAVTVCGAFAALGIWYARRRTDAESFHSATGSRGVITSATSLVALCAGTWVLSSPAETATWAGRTGLIGYALGSAAPLVILAFLGPALRRRHPDAPSIGLMARARWGAPAQLLVSGIALVYMSVYMAAELTAVGGAFIAVAGIDPWFITSLVAVTTLSYAAWGGLRATIFTDAVQFWFVLPLLVTAFAAAIAGMGGWQAANAPLAGSPLMEPLSAAGLGMGVCLMLAIPAANLFDQSQWQRVYACRDAATVRRAFLIAACAIAPIILAAGWFGLWYAGLGLTSGGNGAVFAIIAAKTPQWVALAVLALALLLVMSTLGSLANGIASVVAHDLASFRPGTTPQRRLAIGRWVTVGVALAALPVAAQQFSVTYVFLVADLLCAAAVVPVFAGLCGLRLPLRGLMVSCIAGLVAGGVCFPRTDLTTPIYDVRPLLHLPGELNAFLVSFGLAILVSLVVAVAWPRERRA